MARDRDDDLAALLDDLRTTLNDLDRALARDADDRPPAAPRGSDVVRFTEEYTIPTVISVLETTIQSLELLQGVLRLANPERRFDRDGDGRTVDRVDRRVVDGTERALDDLRRVLTGTEEPSDPVAREVFAEARELTAEIESILAEGRRERGGERRRADREERRSRGSVVIPVDEESAEGGETADDGDDSGDTEAASDDGVEIDVDAELESIRDEVAAESSVGDDGAEDEEEASRGDEVSGED